MATRWLVADIPAVHCIQASQTGSEPEGPVPTTAAAGARAGRPLALRVGAAFQLVKF